MSQKETMCYSEQTANYINALKAFEGSYGMLYNAVEKQFGSCQVDGIMEQFNEKYKDVREAVLSMISGSIYENISTENGEY